MAGHLTGQRSEVSSRDLFGMTRYSFPYGIRFREDRQIELFPAAELSIKGRGTRGIRATFHLDSGATISVLPASDAKALGIPLRRGSKMDVRSVSGETLSGYQHTIAVMLGGTRLTIPVIFVEQVLVPRILGRDGIFPRFAIVFDEARRRVAFIDGNTERQVIDTLFPTSA
jgi:hypothetical protein